MKLFFCCLLSGLFCIAADSVPARDEAKKDVDKIQGEWVIVSVEREGQALPKEEFDGMKRVVKGEEYTILREGNEVAKGKFRMDASKKPCTIDVMTTTQDGEEITLQGIYEVSGDSYKLCIAMPGNPRPTEFKTTAGSGRTMMVSKRPGK